MTAGRGNRRATVWSTASPARQSSVASAVATASGSAGNATAKSASSGLFSFVQAQAIAPADLAANTQSQAWINQSQTAPTFTTAALAAGRRSGDATAQLVARFNRIGLAALDAGHGGGPPVRYGPAERERILHEFRRMLAGAHGNADWGCDCSRSFSPMPGAASAPTRGAFARS